MRYHIVATSECVDDILKSYDLTIDELKNENKHIRVWTNLIPGTKLKIPVLTESIVEDINTIEPFIEDYYPKIKIEEEYHPIEEEKYEQLEVSPVEEQAVLVEDEIQEPKIEIKEETIEEAIKETKGENVNRKMPNYYIPYVYPSYIRPVIYVIPRNKKD